jgi:hypothetical protein
MSVIGQPPSVPHLKAEHMAAPTKAAANVKKALAIRSRPHMARCVIRRDASFCRLLDCQLNRSMHSGQT